MEVIHKNPRTFPVKKPFDVKILLVTLQRNMGHIDTLLDELGVGSLKNKSLRRL